LGGTVRSGGKGFGSAGFLWKELRQAGKTATER
jgi:hypothetical protein